MWNGGKNFSDQFDFCSTGRLFKYFDRTVFWCTYCSFSRQRYVLHKHRFGPGLFDSWSIIESSKVTRHSYGHDRNPSAARSYPTNLGKVRQVLLCTIPLKRWIRSASAITRRGQEYVLPDRFNMANSMVWSIRCEFIRENWLIRPLLFQWKFSWIVFSLRRRNLSSKKKCFGSHISSISSGDNAHVTTSLIR